MLRVGRERRVAYRVYDEEDFPFGADHGVLLEGEPLVELPALPGFPELPETPDRGPRVPPAPRAWRGRGVLRALLAAAAGAVIGLVATSGIRSVSGLAPGGRPSLPAMARVEQHPRSMRAPARAHGSRPVPRRGLAGTRGRRAPGRVAALRASAQTIGVPVARSPQRYAAIEFGFER
jgi:hypothetical protein